MIQNFSETSKTRGMVKQSFAQAQGPSLVKQYTSAQQASEQFDRSGFVKEFGMNWDEQPQAKVLSKEGL